MVSAAIVIANGSEDIEVVATADVLHRGGVEVTLLGMEGTGNVKLANGVTVVPHKALVDMKGHLYDAVIIPGGMGGVNSLKANDNVKDILQNHHKNKKVIGSICAGPLVLKTFGVGVGSCITSYPSVKDQLSGGDYKYKTERVVVDGQLVTSQGPGSSIEFGIKLVEMLMGKEAAAPLAEKMIVNM